MRQPRLPSRNLRLDLVKRAADAAPATIEHVGVDHRRGHIAMAQQLLHGAYVVTLLQQVGGKRVAQDVRGTGLDDAGTLRGRACPDFCVRGIA